MEFFPCSNKVLKIARVTVLSLFMLLAAFKVCAAAESTLPCDGDMVSMKYLFTKDGIHVHRIFYMSDGLKVMGQLFLPESDKPLPCVVFNHDGISGISKEHRLSSIRIARHGYVVFSPSYRGEDESEGEIEIAKGEVKDVLNAIRMLKKIKQVDKNRIALAGASHGALISILAAGRSKDVKAVVAAYGVMDIYKWWTYLKENDKLGNDEITKRTYGDGPDARPQSFKIRNAITQVSKIKAPVLILQGEKDTIVPPDQAKYLKAALDREKIPNQMCLYPDCLHGFLVYVPFLEDEDIEQAERDQTEQAWETMMKFLDKNLK